MHTAGAAAEDDPGDIGVVDVLLGLGERVDLAIHVQLTYPPGNELGILRAMIKDEDGARQRGASQELIRPGG